MQPYRRRGTSSSPAVRSNRQDWLTITARAVGSGFSRRTEITYGSTTTRTAEAWRRLRLWTKDGVSGLHPAAHPRPAVIFPKRHITFTTPQQRPGWAKRKKEA